ncbi:MAG TPA: fasciclin domain-containing protein [Planctomycetota bacterium]|nr:fasciclin domain-containing protein [Planctomycetota bacterium]
MTTPRTLLVCVACLAAACSNEGSGNAAAKPSPPPARKESQLPPLEPDNIVNIALGSKDHTTLVAALQAADYVKSVASTGPLTVFAPTNAAFAKLPAGTLESLMKPENQAALKEIIKFHATTTAYEQSSFKDGQQLAMANGKKVTFHVANGKVKVDDANIVASVRASNGIVHIIDGVLLPPKN